MNKLNPVYLQLLMSWETGFFNKNLQEFPYLYRWGMNCIIVILW